MLARSVLQAFERAPGKVPPSVVLGVCDSMDKVQACQVLKRLFEVNLEDANVQAKYLDVLVDVDFVAAREL